MALSNSTGHIAHDYILTDKKRKTTLRNAQIGSQISLTGLRVAGENNADVTAAVTGIVSGVIAHRTPHNAAQVYVTLTNGVVIFAA